MMKKQILLFLGLMFIAINGASAQNRSVTNADLEKFRQKRVLAERDYRENYEKLGLPSPEELDKRRVQNAKELAELSERLRYENLQREQKEREDEYRQAQILVLRGNAGQYNQGAYYNDGYYSSGFFGAYPYYGYQSGYYDNRYYNNRFRNRRDFGRGTNIYNSVTPGTVFPPPGVRISSGGAGISGTGGFRFPVRIGNPR